MTRGKYVRTTETIEKLRQALSGKKHTLETRQRMSGRGNSHYVHGLTDHQHYSRWWNMMDRCYNPLSDDYKYYGARGVQVCLEWHDVIVFCAWMDEHMGPKPEGYSFNRLDNDGPYSPDNVEWATYSQQNRNRSVWGQK